MGGVAVVSALQEPGGLRLAKAVYWLLLGGTAVAAATMTQPALPAAKDDSKRKEELRAAEKLREEQRALELEARARERELELEMPVESFTRTCSNKTDGKGKGSLSDPAVSLRTKECETMSEVERLLRVADEETQRKRQEEVFNLQRVEERTTLKKEKKKQHVSTTKKKKMTNATGKKVKEETAAAAAAEATATATAKAKVTKEKKRKKQEKIRAEKKERREAEDLSRRLDEEERIEEERQEALRIDKLSKWQKPNTKSNKASNKKLRSSNIGGNSNNHALQVERQSVDVEEKKKKIKHPTSTTTTMDPRSTSHFPALKIETETSAPPADTGSPVESPSVGGKKKKDKKKRNKKKNKQ